MFVCFEGMVKASPVLIACGVPKEYVGGTLRLSVGRHTTNADVVTAAIMIGDVIEELLDSAKQQ